LSMHLQLRDRDWIAIVWLGSKQQHGNTISIAACIEQSNDHVCHAEDSTKLVDLTVV